MPKRKRKRRATMSQGAYNALVRRHKRSKRAEALSKSRNHIPVRLLEERLAKMPRHMHELARLIKQRKDAGE